MTTPPRAFCSQLSRQRDDPMAGSVPYCRTWVLIEYREAWPTNGFDGLELSPGVVAAVNDAARDHAARILLIRRHGRRIPGGSARWAVLRYHDSGAYRQHWGHWSADTDLLQIPAALAAPGQFSLSPVVLVCTHGVHDACCAVWGRPVSAALSEAWPEAVWECSHLGGDRFAPTMAILPDGAYYGRLDADSAVRVLDDHVAGQIRADHLRGYSSLRPAAQVAVAEVLRRSGPAGRHDVRLVRTHRLETGTEVELDVAGLDERVRVGLTSRRSPPERLTCRGPQPASAVYWDVVHVSGLPDRPTDRTIDRTTGGRDDWSARRAAR